MKIFYASFSRLDASVNSVYIKGLRDHGIEVIPFSPECKDWRRYSEVNNALNSVGNDCDLIMVGYDSPQLVTYLKVIAWKPVIYNALCSVYERRVVSRGLSGRFSLRSFYYWWLDFMASKFSDLIMLETNLQIEYYKKIFLVSSKKCFRAWIGANDSVFSNVRPGPKFSRFTAVFKGQFVPESGAEHVVRMAKLLEDSGVDVILAGGGPHNKHVISTIEKLAPKNLIFLNEFLPQGRMLELMKMSHVVLGQLTSHPRLSRTIPHKCFESLAMGLLYITARNSGVRELLTDGENCLMFNPGDINDLAKKILLARDRQEEISRIAERAGDLYARQLKPYHLAGALLDRIRAENISI